MPPFRHRLWIYSPACNPAERPESLSRTHLVWSKKRGEWQSPFSSSVAELIKTSSKPLACQIHLLLRAGHVIRGQSMGQINSTWLALQTISGPWSCAPLLSYAPSPPASPGPMLHAAPSKLVRDPCCTQRTPGAAGERGVACVPGPACGAGLADTTCCIWVDCGPRGSTWRLENGLRSPEPAYGWYLWCTYSGLTSFLPLIRHRDDNSHY